MPAEFFLVQCGCCSSDELLKGMYVAKRGVARIGLVHALHSCKMLKCSTGGISYNATSETRNQCLNLGHK